jgi:hypothetical protein
MAPHVDLPTSFVEAAEALSSFPHVPVTVITATRGLTDPCHEPPCEEIQATWMKVQEEFAATLTTDVRHVLSDTGHFVHLYDPELVDMEIRALLARTEH